MYCVGDAVGVPTTLHESAAAEQAKRHKVELEEVDVKTGEEDECNVFQVTRPPTPPTAHQTAFRTN